MRWRIEDTKEQAEFRTGFKAWLADNLPPGWMEACEAEDDEAWEGLRSQWDSWEWNRKIGASGYAAPLWPKEYGGFGGENWSLNLVREELGRYRLPRFGVNILGIGLAGPTLIAHGSDEQKSRYLAKILTAEEVWCQLFSEPGSGSDLASLSAKATRDGDDWVVNGQKVWTSIAQFSHFGMLAVRTDAAAPKHEGISYFILPMQSDGVEVRPLRQMTGGSEFNEVYLTDVRIPDENRVGEINDGWAVCRTTLMNERVALSGLSPEGFFLGARKDPWEGFLSTIGGRDDFLARQNIAQYYIENELKEITGFRAALARSKGEQPGAEGSVGKVFNAEMNQRRTNFAMNAAGPAAIAWMTGDNASESRAHAFLRARGYTIEGGTSEVLRNQIGERILGLPREPEVDRGIPWKDIKRN
jgi:alkylation response protein AidB-like acyl-CoA dehydrogenase